MLKMDDLKEAIQNLHEDFMKAMNSKYISQFAENEIKDIFDTPMNFMNWCIRENKININT